MPLTLSAGWMQIQGLLEKQWLQVLQNQGEGALVEEALAVDQAAAVAAAGNQKNARPLDIMIPEALFMLFYFFKIIHMECPYLVIHNIVKDVTDIDRSLNILSINTFI